MLFCILFLVFFNLVIFPFVSCGISPEMKRALTEEQRQQLSTLEHKPHHLETSTLPPKMHNDTDGLNNELSFMTEVSPPSSPRSTGSLKTSELIPTLKALTELYNLPKESYPTGNYVLLEEVVSLLHAVGASASEKAKENTGGKMLSELAKLKTLVEETQRINLDQVNRTELLNQKLTSKLEKEVVREVATTSGTSHSTSNTLILKIFTILQNLFLKRVRNDKSEYFAFPSLDLNYIEQKIPELVSWSAKEEPLTSKNMSGQLSRLFAIIHTRKS